MTVAQSYLCFYICDKRNLSVYCTYAGNNAKLKVRRVYVECSLPDLHKVGHKAGLGTAHSNIVEDRYPSLVFGKIKVFSLLLMSWSLNPNNVLVVRCLSTPLQPTLTSCHRKWGWHRGLRGSLSARVESRSAHCRPHEHLPASHRQLNEGDPRTLLHHQTRVASRAGILV